MFRKMTEAISSEVKKLEAYSRLMSYQEKMVITTYCCFFLS